MINPNQLRTEIIRPTLKAMSMWSPAAENLLMGTAMQESVCGTYLVQIGGPALGLFQIEPSTARDIVFRYLDLRPDLGDRFELGFQIVNSHEINWNNVSLDKVALKLISDLRFGTAVARMRYWMVPQPLPDADDVAGLAAYWKQHYNTPLGRSTEEEFIRNYKKVSAIT